MLLKTDLASYQILLVINKIMGTYFTDAGLFLIDTIIGLYILVVLLRFLFRLVGAEFYNPISQAIVKISNPMLRPLQRFLPTFRGIDFAALLLLIILESIRISILAISMAHIPKLSGVLTLSIAKLLQLTVYVMVFALFIRAILSWMASGTNHFFLGLLHSLTEPLMNKARRILPRTGVIDFSPILVFVFLMLVLKLLVQPLLDFGRLLI